MKVRNGLFEKLSRVPTLKEYYGMLINMLQKYYCIWDLEYSANKHQVFSDLYVKRKGNRMVAIENNISESTLTRYIRKFEETAIKIILKEENLKVIKQYLNINKMI